MSRTSVWFFFEDAQREYGAVAVNGALEMVTLDGAVVVAPSEPLRRAATHALGLCECGEHHPEGARYYVSVVDARHGEPKKKRGAA